MIMLYEDKTKRMHEVLDIDERWQIRKHSSYKIYESEVFDNLLL